MTEGGGAQFARPGVVGFEKKVLRQATVIPGDTLQLHHGGLQLVRPDTTGSRHGTVRGRRVVMLMVLMMIASVGSGTVSGGAIHTGKSTPVHTHRWLVVPVVYRRSRLPRCCSVGSLPVAEDARTAAELPSPSRTAVAVFSRFVRLVCSSLVELLTRRRSISVDWDGSGRGGEARGSFDPVPGPPSVSASAVRRAVSASRIEGKPPPVRLRRSRRFVPVPEAFAEVRKDADGVAPAPGGLGFF
uniref:Uncharacterized protein n=1 Tax=Anopheles culicifacies TaxID=139723 RepID=A0A182MGX1_9DIPT